MGTKRLVNVSDAARILSGSTKTIRRWDAKLGPQRDRNGYRVYDPDLRTTRLYDRRKGQVARNFVERISI